MKIKVGTQLPSVLHRQLKIAAARDNVSMDEIITWAIEDFLKKKRKGKCIYDRLYNIEEKLNLWKKL